MEVGESLKEEKKDNVITSFKSRRKKDIDREKCIINAIKEIAETLEVDS